MKAFRVSIASTAKIFAPAASMNATQSLKELKKGNERYVSGRLIQYDFAKTRKELVKEQHPFATILTCSDSRISPAFIFNRNLGELFVVRTAGDVVGRISLGSIEYGCEHLHTPLLVVMGHTFCGAVKATCDCHGHCEDGHISHIVHTIAPTAKKQNFDWGKSIRANVRDTISHIRTESEIIQTLEKKKQIKIVGAMYDLETGKVTFF